MIRATHSPLRRSVGITCGMLLVLSAGAGGQEAGAAQHKTNPFTGDPEAVQQGRALYMKWGCYGCHGTQGGGGMGPNLVDEEWRYGGDDASVFQSIHAGRPGGMPPWAERLSEEEVWKVIAYLRSIYQGSPDEVVR